MRPLLLLLLTASLNAPANADDIKIPLGQQGLVNLPHPSRGDASHQSLAGITATFPSISRVTG